MQRPGQWNSRRKSSCGAEDAPPSAAAVSAAPPPPRFSEPRACLDAIEASPSAGHVEPAERRGPERGTWSRGHEEDLITLFRFPAASGLWRR